MPALFEEERQAFSRVGIAESREPAEINQAESGDRSKNSVSCMFHVMSVPAVDTNDQFNIPIHNE